METLVWYVERCVFGASRLRVWKLARCMSIIVIYAVNTIVNIYVYLLNLNVLILLQTELAAGLAEDQWLRALDCQNCGVEDAGAASVATLLAVNRTITVFDLRNNHVSKPLWHTIKV